MSKTSKSERNLGVIALLAIGAVGLAAVAVYVHKAPKVDFNPPPQPISKPNPAQQQQPKVATKITVYLPSLVGDDIKLTGQPESIPEGQDPIVFAINSFLRQTHIVDPQARLLSAQVRDGVAILDFNPAFRATYGSFDERSILYSVGAILGQIQNIDSFTFHVEGQPLESIGSVDLSDPLPVIRDPEHPDQTAAPKNDKNIPPVNDPSRPAPKDQDLAPGPSGAETH